MAVEVAALTRPSISAPLKFLVSAASSATSTSGASFPFSLIRAVWIRRIWTRPFSSGSPAATVYSPTLSLESSEFIKWLHQEFKGQIKQKCLESKYQVQAAMKWQNTVTEISHKTCFSWKVSMGHNITLTPFSFAIHCINNKNRVQKNPGFLPARRYASAGLCDSDVSVCLSVRLSVCHAGIVPSRAKAGSWNVYHLIAPSL